MENTKNKLNQDLQINYFDVIFKKFNKFVLLALINPFLKNHFFYYYSLEAFIWQL